MIERSIEWLKKADLNKRFYVCKEADRKHVNDPDFENWILADSHKRYSICFGEKFQTNDVNFSFISAPFPRPKIKNDPFPQLEPFYTRYTCSWDYVTKVYQGDGGGYAYIFVRKTIAKKPKKN